MLPLKVDRLLIVSVGISMMTCTGINDYSCGFLFAFLMIWTKNKSRHEAAFIMYILIPMIIYDIIWILIYGEAWFFKKAQTAAWADKAFIRGFSFFLFAVNVVFKILIARYVRQIKNQGTGREEDKNLIEEEGSQPDLDVEEVPEDLFDNE